MITVLALAGIALMFTMIGIAWRLDRRAVYRRAQEDYRMDMAERRAIRRSEARGRHHRLIPFPGDTEAFERVTADTGELTAITDELAAAAESGDFKTIAGSNAAFLRRLDLTRLYRLARERTGAAV
jgi:hypothetical protein